MRDDVVGIAVLGVLALVMVVFALVTPDVLAKISSLGVAASIAWLVLEIRSELKRHVK